MKVVTATEAASLIPDGAWVIPGGFGSCGHPDALTRAVAQRFLRTGHPRSLSLLFAAGAGDKGGQGLDVLAHEGLIARAVGGYWGLCPSLSAQALDGCFEAHNWPQGIVSNLFTAIASKTPGIFSHVGLGTFVDPDDEGGVIRSELFPSLVTKQRTGQGECLFYPSLPVHCVLLRGSVSDRYGNISLEGEVSLMDALAQAQAAKTHRGCVIVQVQRLQRDAPLPAASIRIPGFLVDYVVVSAEGDHPRSYGAASSAADGVSATTSAVRDRIAARAAREALAWNGHAVLNLGIGIPAHVGAVLPNDQSNFTLTVESGLIGGTPRNGLSFGDSELPVSWMDQSELFNFYDGGGLDIAFLGFAQVDGAGNVNVSRFQNRLMGAGGFINISQSAKKIVFCGTTTAGRQSDTADVSHPHRDAGGTTKFVHRLEQTTFSASRARDAGKEVLYVTELGVLRLTRRGLELIEVAPSVSLEELSRVIQVPYSLAPTLRPMAVVPGREDPERTTPRSRLPCSH